MSDTQTLTSPAYFELCNQLVGARMPREVRHALDGLLMELGYQLTNRTGLNDEPLRAAWGKVAAAMPAEWGTR